MIDIEKLDLRVQKTYLSLLTALEDLLEHKQFADISVTEICQQAMIRRPTFYKHFIDKYDFLTFFVKQKMKIIFEHAFEQNENIPINFFTSVFEGLLKLPDNILTLIIRLQTETNIMNELVGIQEYGQTMLRKNLDSQTMNHPTIDLTDYQAQIIMGITIQSVNWYKNNSKQLTSQEMLNIYQQTLKKLF